MHEDNAAAGAVNSMTLRQARDILARDLLVNGTQINKLSPQDVDIVNQYNQHCIFKPKDIVDLAYEDDKDVIYITLNPAANYVPLNRFNAYGQEPCHITGDGREVANALWTFKRLALNADAQTSQASQENFNSIADQYRSASPKPGPTEEIRKFQIQVDTAVSDKDFVSAENILSHGIAEAPWWPPFHFNRALILGQLDEYDHAIVEMQRYLQLVPDAPNARAAKDKIYAWQEKSQGNGASTQQQ
jgi:hypothetical protein